MAVKTDPKNDQAWYNLALLYNEMKDNTSAMVAFDKAIQLKSDNIRLYYNYGLLLQQNGNVVKAINVLQQGLKQNPSDESLNYAMAYVYIQNRQTEKAFPYVRLLKNVNPQNPDYQQLFAVTGIK